jgi:hypothetical protein
MARMESIWHLLPDSPGPARQSMLLRETMSLTLRDVKTLKTRIQSIVCKGMYVPRICRVFIAFPRYQSANGRKRASANEITKPNFSHIISNPKTLSVGLAA